AKVAAREERTLPFGGGAGGRRPPQIAVTRRAILEWSVQLRRFPMLACAVLHPIRRNDLLPVPLAAPRHDEAEPCHVASRKKHVVGEITRLILVSHHALACLMKVLHLQWPSQVSVQGVEYLFPCRLFEDRAGDVEIPVVVKKIFTRLVRAARWNVRLVAT